MTREEALSILKSILADLQRGANDTDNVSCCLEYGFITYGKAKDCIKVLEQEPFKLMVEIDLDYVIKQKYIEREVLDKIRAEITDCLKALDEIEKSGLDIYLPNEMSGRRLTYQQCLEFIDKYKAETEQEDGK